MPVPGELLGNRYRLEDRIAAGGMGEVWQATDTVLGRDVAVKTLRAGRSGDPDFEVRFRHEARAMAALHHPGIADVYDFGEDDADAYIVMEHVKGTALNQLIAQRGRLTPDETMSIVAQAARALEAAHQAGIVHRDVKPGNLIIQPDGTVVLVDFGVARSAESAALTGAREVVGTALYIAPEQVSKAETGPAADLYALGAVAYHCLAGHPPFAGESPIAVALQHVQDEPPPLPPDVPDPVRALVARAMAKNPADRFPSAAAMAVAASQISSGDTTTLLPATADSARTLPVPAPVPPRDTLPDSAGPPATSARHRTLLTTAAVVIALGVAATVLVWANPGGIFPGSADPTPAVTTSNAPASQGSGEGAATTTKPKQTQTQTNNNTGRPVNPPATKPSSGTPSSPQSEQPSDPVSEPPSNPTSQEPSAPGDDNGGGDNNGGGNDDNSGPGGGGGNDSASG